jgi:hypothetical protein
MAKNNQATVASILPPKASPMQRDLEQVGLGQVFLEQDTDAAHALWQAMTQLSHYKTKPLSKKVPESHALETLSNDTHLIDALSWEYGLEDVQPYAYKTAFFKEAQSSTLDERNNNFFANSIRWQRTRGTPESVRIAMGWLDFNVAVQSFSGSHFHEYQLQLLPNLAQVQASQEKDNKEGNKEGNKEDNKEGYQEASSENHQNLGASAASTKALSTKQEQDPKEPSPREILHQLNQGVEKIRNLNQFSAPARAKLTRIVTVPSTMVDRQPITLSGSNSAFGQILSDFDGVRHHSGIRLALHEAHEIGHQYQGMQIYSVQETHLTRTQHIEPTLLVSQAQHLVQKWAWHSQRQWLGTWSASVWGAAQEVTGQRQLRVHKRWLDANISPVQQDDTQNIMAEALTWDIQTQLSQHQHLAQNPKRLAQRQWMGAWSALDWCAEHQVMGQRQTRAHKRWTDASISPVQQDATLGEDVQEIAWQLQVHRTQAQTLSEPFDMSANQQWYGGWQSVGWAAKPYPTGCRRERHTSRWLDASISLEQKDDTQNIMVEALTWDIQTQRIQHQHLAQNPSRLAQRQWMGAWSALDWCAEHQVLGQRQARVHKRWLDAKISLEQQDATFGDDVQEIVWQLQVHRTQAQTLSEPFDMGANQQWLGVWQSGGWGAKPYPTGSRRERTSAVFADAKISLEQQDATLGDDVQEVVWQLQVHRTQAQTLSEPFDMSANQQWYGGWQSGGWAAKPYPTGSRRERTSAVFTNAKISPLQQDDTQNIMVEALTWDIQTQRIQHQHLAQNPSRLAQRQWMGAWSALDWCAEHQVMGQRQTRAHKRWTDASISLLQQDATLGDDVQEVFWQLQVHRTQAQTLSEPFDMDANQQWYGGWQSGGWAAKPYPTGSRRARTSAAFVAAKLASVHKAGLGQATAHLDWHTHPAQCLQRTFSQPFALPEQAQWYGSWQAESWTDDHPKVGQRHLNG